MRPPRHCRRFDQRRRCCSPPPRLSLAQSQLPRPGQLPPAGGQGGPPQRGTGRAAATARNRRNSGASKPYKPVRSPRRSRSTIRASRRSASSSARSPRRRTARRSPALVAQNFFWMGEKGDKADKKKPGIDNLAKAIQLDGKDAAGLGDARRGLPPIRPARRFRIARTRSARRPIRPSMRRSFEALAQVDRHRGRRLGLSDAGRPRGARRPAAQFAGGREARPAFRARDGGRDAPATSRSDAAGRRAIRQDRLRAGRGR